MSVQRLYERLRIVQRIYFFATLSNSNSSICCCVHDSDTIVQLEVFSAVEIGVCLLPVLKKWKAILIRYAISHILNNNHIIPDTYFLFLIK
jgi:hypothetical protein